MRETDRLFLFSAEEKRSQEKEKDRWKKAYLER